MAGTGRGDGCPSPTDNSTPPHQPEATMYRFQYARFDAQLMAELASFDGLLQLFNYLLLKTDGDVEHAMEWMRRLLERGLLQQLGLAQTEAELEAFFDELRRQEYVKQDPSGSGQLVLGARGERGIRKDALRLIFEGLKKGGFGDHNIVHDGQGQDPLPELRPFSWGDDLRTIDFNRSFQNALRHGSLQLNEDDLEVRATEHNTSCATALLVDISHSMTLYGEDRITPAKQVALALSELILTEFPRDKLTIILFGDEPGWSRSPTCPIFRTARTTPTPSRAAGGAGDPDAAEVAQQTDLHDHRRQPS